MPEKKEAIEVRESRATVSRSMGKNAVETETQETIDIHVFQTNPATVSIKGGATVNLGNYESARVDVMLTMPCYREEIDATFEVVKNWVDERVANEYREIKASTVKKA